MIKTLRCHFAHLDLTDGQPSCSVVRHEGNIPVKETLQWRSKERNFTKAGGGGRRTRRLSESFAGVQVRGLESWAGCTFAMQSHSA